MNELHLQESIRKAVTEAPGASLLSGTSIQARNFTSRIGSGRGIAPAFFRKTSLLEDMYALCDPAVEPEGDLFLNMVLKYFHAYVHDGSHVERVAFGDIAILLEGFARHQSLNEPGDDAEVMNRMRNWSGALRCLADVPRAAYIAGKVASAKLPDDHRDRRPHLGMDIGAASGLLVLALWVQAHRNGFTYAIPCGFLTDPIAGERTTDLLRLLDAGTIIPADPARSGSYASIYGLKVDFVANETLALLQGNIDRRRCFARYEALFQAAGDKLDGTVFLPEGWWPTAAGRT
ncbi:hypothetical protein [Salidesulfovibrio brasiliensis]|uniref:hypothetical protein n=1 Tax=Salidesulfovibrio brasiliensis TaxID=221711 RepID=UPI0006D1E7A2|nr:hypothetical protein [Salidesulfovibrio brasiliensis]